MSEVIVVTSGKGGVGKTTTTANIGAALALEGKRVVLIDTDIGLRNLDLVMGLENRVVYTLVDVIEEKCRSIKQALIKDKRFHKLYIVPAAPSGNKYQVKPEQMLVVCDELGKEFDYVLIDCPAGIETGFEIAIAAADTAIVVTTPEVSAVRDADCVIGLLESNYIKNHKLVINKVRPEMVRKGDMLSINDIVEILAEELLGVIPDDESVIVSTNRGEPIALSGRSAAGKSYRDIAKRIIGESVPLTDYSRKKTFIEKVFGRNERGYGYEA